MGIFHDEMLQTVDQSYQNVIAASLGPGNDDSGLKYRRFTAPPTTKPKIAIVHSRRNSDAERTILLIITAVRARMIDPTSV